MANMQGLDNYQLLISKLDQFIRKFYVNKMIRGTLYFIGLSFLLFLVFSLAEHNFYFAKSIRKGMLYGFLTTSLVSFGYWVLLPLFKYFHLGSTITHEQAANIIGTHFTDVQDKLINVLQLKKQADSSENTELLLAGINQKSENIKLVPFKNAIDLYGNKRYLKYALPPLLLFFAILFGAPSIIKDSTFRILNNNQDFEKDAPFRFLLEEQEFQVVQYNDFDLNVQVDGLALPDEVFIDVDNYQYRMKKIKNDQFEYTFKNVQKDTPFRIFAGNVKSANYNLNVLEKPNLLDFTLALDYPAYTGTKDEVVSNIGDVSIPAGTVVTWNFTSEHTDKILMDFERKSNEIKRTGEQTFLNSKKILSDLQYKVLLYNKLIPYPDSFLYNLNVIPDQHPSIQVEKFEDSLDNTVIYFAGSAADDYGISNITFNYTITSEKGGAKPLVTEKLYSGGAASQQYDYIFDINKVNLEPGDNISYYFEVTDNDQVNGVKSAKTSVMNFRKLSQEELKKEEKQNSEAIKKDLEEALKESKEIKEELKKLREKLIQKKEIDWQTKKELEKLLERQQELQEKMQQAKQNFDKNKDNKELQKKSEELQEKEEKLEKMFEELLDDETKELMEKIKDLMEEMKKDDAVEMMEEMEFSDEELETELDRLKELYKQLEVEKAIEDMVEDLKELAEEEKKLSEETKEGETPKEELEKKQEEIKEKFEELKEEMKELEEKNEELEKPKDIGEKSEEKMDEISEDMEESEEQMKSEDSKGASESQKKAAEKMEKMAGEMMAAAQSGEMEQMEEDIKAIRQLLENIVTLSFDQEDLVNTFAQTSEQTPRYVDLVKEQFKLKDDFQLVADSLAALAKRQVQIESFVLEKVGDIRKNLDTGIKRLEDRAKSIANENQRNTMTGLNDLALMLNESMEQMQQQMSGMMPGSQMCNKPGGSGKGSSGGKNPQDKISDGQQGMKESLQKMMQNAKDGKGNSSKDFAKAAAKQASLRKALQEIAKEKKESGKGAGGLDEIIDQMDKIETDLVNKKLDAQMMARQQDILTRLLEAEKADRQRDQDEKRKAENTTEKVRQFPPSLEEYLKKRESEIDAYKTVSPALKPYYKFLVEQYYQSLKTK